MNGRPETASLVRPARTPTGKARVLRALRVAPVPLTVPDLVALTGLDRRGVWDALVCLRRCRAVRKLNGRRRGRTRLTRWEER